MSYIKYIQNEDHYKEVLSKAAKVKESLWIGTADIKDLYVGDEPFLALLAKLKGSASYPRQRTRPDFQGRV